MLWITIGFLVIVAILVLIVVAQYETIKWHEGVRSDLCAEIAEKDKAIEDLRCGMGLPDGQFR